MTSFTKEFFEGLSASRKAWIPEQDTRSVRFEVTDHGASEHWRVGIGQGRVRVSHDESAVDCVVRADRALFDDLASGRANAMAALLRGALAIEGDPVPLVLIQRLFPGPPVATISRPDPAMGTWS